MSGFYFKGVETAAPAPGVLEAIRQADLVVFCPSNPWVSIDPMLAIPGMRESILQRPAVAVSPIIGGQTVKGPAAKMFTELGLQASAFAVAQHYQDLLRGFVFDLVDREQAEGIRALGIAILATHTIMKSPHKRIDLAKEVIEFGLSLLEEQRG